MGFFRVIRNAPIASIFIVLMLIFCAWFFLYDDSSPKAVKKYVKGKFPISDYLYKKADKKEILPQNNVVKQEIKEEEIKKSCKGQITDSNGNLIDNDCNGNGRSSFAFQNHVTEIFDTPANLLNTGISNVVNEYQTNSVREYKKIDARHSITNANISFHVRQILTSLNKLYEDFKINNWLSAKALIIAVLLFVILGLELFLLFKVFCYVFMTYLEKIIYLSLVIFMLPLGFFQQTRGFLVSYVKKIISLTFYMPLLLLLVLFNSFALQYAIKVGSNEIVAKFDIIVVIGISLTFIQKVPEMINAIFGTQGGLSDAKSFIYQGVQIASAGAGAVAGSLKSVGRSAFGRTLEAYKDAKSTINSTTTNMRDMPGHLGVRMGVETIELPKSHRANKFHHA
ncbi:hypothetical protein VN0645_11700 [Helicobacter pylori]|nr:hypothetical protein VN0645_11700 [Helicobacter pylori]